MKENEMENLAGLENGIKSKMKKTVFSESNTCFVRIKCQSRKQVQT